MAELPKMLTHSITGMSGEEWLGFDKRGISHVAGSGVRNAKPTSRGRVQTGAQVTTFVMTAWRSWNLPN